MATHIDPEKDVKYPVVLSDALMGRGTKELITGIRYNHKPTDSCKSSLKDAQIKQSSSSDPDMYDLSFIDDSGRYKYQGTRFARDGQYILVFDTFKKHFVLHQLDSSFDMNLTSVPWSHEAGSLQDNYEQLQSSSKSRRKSSSQRTRATKANTARDNIEDTKKRKVEKAKKKPPPREPTPDAEDEDSDDGFTVEYPGGAPPSRLGIRSSPMQRLADIALVTEKGDADVDLEEEDEPNNDVDDLQLPSPAAVAAAVDDDSDELDLEAELEHALENESSESEEE